MADEQRTISLADYAHKEKLSWSQAWKKALTGEIRAEKRGGRWYVLAQEIGSTQGKRAPRPAA